MDKDPYFTDKICISSTKKLIFVHFSILAQQTSLHNGEGESSFLLFIISLLFGRGLADKM